MPMQPYTRSQNIALLISRFIIAAIFLYAAYVKLPFWSFAPEGMDPAMVNIIKILSIAERFGGGMSLQLALNENMAATGIYYGRLVTDKESLSVITWPALGIFGSADTGIPVEQVNAFETALNEINVENEIYIYEGVGHAFANPSGQNYAPEETKNAWQKTVAFFDKHLK